MIDNEPYFYDPKSGWTGWKRDGLWRAALGDVWYMNRQTVTWFNPTSEQIERFESLCVAV